VIRVSRGDYFEEALRHVKREIVVVGYVDIIAIVFVVVVQEGRIIWSPSCLIWFYVVLLSLMVRYNIYCNFYW